MRVAYIRTAKGLPTEARQREALAAAGVEPDELAEAWVDRPMKGKPSFVQRDYMLGAVREDDEVWIARPAIGASGEGDGIAFLEAITKAGAVLCVAATGTRHKWTPDLADALAWVKAARADERGLVMAKARAGRKLGRKTFEPQQWKEGRRLWADQSVTAIQAAERSGIGMRTLYRELGPKGTAPFGKVKGKRK
jgi:hypothetical protein